LLDFTRYSKNTRNEMWFSVHLCLFQISWSMFLPRIDKIGLHLRQLCGASLHQWLDSL